ncbi:hypothetical protein [Halobacterium sp. KA-6]|uniref:hypothetical protein n=1 Tax=Halobacterium sp. KA-6 TaxID=2896368 RepID=UPI001E465A9B|nr:hypothetical protein [Halobacterium sp. KA-6]MCD2203679.1 hypothetical protein [Halobacterium sp. KA-6]
MRCERSLGFLPLLKGWASANTAVTSVDNNDIIVVFEHCIEKAYLEPKHLADVCEKHDLSQYSFTSEELAFEPQY